MAELWKALADGEIVPAGAQKGLLSVVDCGTLHMPSGKLVACDPFAAMRRGGSNPFVRVPPGDHRVKVTVADLSEARDRSHLREAYASLLLSPHPELRREFLVPLPEGETPPKLEPDEFVGFPVDAGTACFVDDEALVKGMPDESTWYESLFENDSPDSWFNRMDDPGHICAGIANIPLPLARDGSNLILFHSGYGDGVYPVLGGYDAQGRLAAVHIDFLVVGE